MPSDPIPPDVRDRAVEALKHGFASDRLSEEELETLLDRVYGATTLTELNALIQHLPVPLSDAGVASVSPDVAGSAQWLALPPPARISAFLSGQERKLTGLVPRHMRLRARLGHVELDLAHATFEPGVTVINVGALMGYVKIRFPGDIRVESDGRALLGYFSLESAEPTGPVDSERVVRVTGQATLGFAECHVGSREG